MTILTKRGEKMKKMKCMVIILTIIAVAGFGIYYLSDTSAAKETEDAVMI